jgi:uncharacterized membrane protein YdjX (TVP38/TMEM64 family)
VRENLPLASLGYVALTVACCVLLALPGLTFALSAGLLFGPVLGTLLCLLATTCGASLAFLAGRYFLKDAVRPLVEKNRRLKRILFDDIGRSGMLLLMITRLLPIFPYNIQNFAYGITSIGFWPYTLYTFIFMFPGVAFFTIGAAGIAFPEGRRVYFSLAGASALVVSAIGLCLYRRFVEPDAAQADRQGDGAEEVRHDP